MFQQALEQLQRRAEHCRRAQQDSLAVCLV
jgi:hypothetical protein